MAAIVIVAFVLFHKRSQQFPLLETQQPFKAFYIFFEVFFGFLGLVVILWIK